MKPDAVNLGRTGVSLPGSLNETGSENDEEPPGSPAAPEPVPPSVPLSRPARKLNVISVLRTRIPSSPRVSAFRRAYFPAVSEKEWNDWQWQVRHRIRTLEQLERMLVLSDSERGAIERAQARLPVGITPYFMSLIAREDPTDPLRRTVIPTLEEFVRSPGEDDDPLGEETQSPVRGLVHRYPDRVLLLVLDFCSTYCRYCTRSRIVGHGAIYPSRARLEQAIDYIRRTPTVRDVLISGGDPLTLNDERLAWLLSRLRAIPHVEIIRIGTKIPAVLPQRITPALVRMLRHYHPLWMSLHFTHPAECTPEAVRACERLANAGIPLGSQTVLLKGINDTVPVMRELCHRLLRMRVRPYYLYQCDPITGSAHFRTAVHTGLEILEGLRGHTSGYAVPTFVVDAPGGGGKIPLMPEAIEGREGRDLLLRNFRGRTCRYPDVFGEAGA